MAMMDMIDCVRDYLDNDNWNYEYRDDRNMLVMGVTIKSKLQSVKLYMIFNENGYTSTAICSMKADENCRNAVMEYITRANYGLRNGAFEMDVRDGEVRYRSYVPYREMASLPEGIIKESVGVPVLMFERYGDGLAALMFGFSDPETEIKRAESKE